MDSPSNPRPFLRRGAGFAARVAAAKAGRRYVPPGGAIKDYSAEEEAASGSKMPSLAKLLAGGGAPPCAKASTSAALPLRGRRGGPSAPGGTSGAASATSPPAAKAKKSSRTHIATKLPAPTMQHVPPSQEQQLQQPKQRRAVPQEDQHPAAAPTVQQATDWARRLLASNTAVVVPALHTSGSTLGAEEDAELAEFQALENAVLVEVGNTANVPDSPAQQRRASAADHKKNSTSGGSSVQHTACGAAQEQQAPVHREANALEQQPEEGAVFASDDKQDKSAKPSNSAYAAMPQPLTGEMPMLGSLELRSSFLPRGPDQPNARLVQRLFAHTQPPAQAAAGASGNALSQVETPAAAMDRMQQEIVRLQEERARVARLRVQLEEGAARLAAEQAAFERRKAEEAARVEAERAEGQRKLARDRRVLEKQSRAIMRLPSQREKEEVKAVEALLEQEKRNGRARDARHKLQAERLRKQLAEAQQRLAEQAEELAYLEQQRLEGRWGLAAAAPASQPDKLSASISAGPEQRSPISAAPSPVKPRSGSAASHGTGLRSRLMVVRSEAARTAASAAGASRAPAAAAIQDKEDEDGGDGTVVVDVRPSDELVVEAMGCQGCSAEAWEIPAGPEPKAVRVSPVVLQHKASQVLHSGPPAAGTAKRTTGQLAANTGPAKPSNAVAAAPSPTAAPAATSNMSAETGDAMARAAAALGRFNTLRASLGSSRGTSLAPSPSAIASCGEAAGAAPLVAPADDLRRLGRILSSGGGAGDSVMATESGQTLPSLSLLPCLPALPTMPSSSDDAIKPGSVADTVISSQQQPDGRLDRLFSSGLRETRFANGSIRRVLSDGVAVTRFPNGDVKRSLPGGVTEYWYAAVDSWQVSHPGTGVEVFHFASGQVEAHHPGGVREVCFADGSLRRVLPDGRELELSAVHLSSEMHAPRPAPPDAFF